MVRIVSKIERWALSHSENGDNPKDEWIDAKVPSTVQSSLLEKGLIEDPYFGKNC